MIGEANFIYSSLGKAFKRLVETTEDQRKKQINAIINQKERKVGITDNANKLSLKEKTRKNILSTC